MLSIRLARIGTNKRPFYRIIVCERSRDTYGKFLEILGTYNTFTKDLQIDAEKVKSWIFKGAQLTPTLNNLFIDKKIIDKKEKVKTRRSNTQKLIKRREEGKKKADEAKLAAEAAKEAAKKDEEEAASAAKIAAEATVEAAVETTESVPVVETPVENA